MKDYKYTLLGLGFILIKEREIKNDFLINHPHHYTIQLMFIYRSATYLDNILEESWSKLPRIYNIYINVERA